MRAPRAAANASHARRHVVRRSVETPRQPDDQRREAVLFRREPGEFGHGTIDRVAVEPGGLQYAKRPRQRARGVADRHTDPPLADIESCHASHAV